jgi:heme-degrading monooxygenase HmoA
MIEVFYRYTVHPAQARAFEHAYGQSGPWVALFKRHDGFIRTRLFRQKADAHVYLTIDAWESKEAYDRFRSDNAAEYRRLDAQLGMLKLEELLLGYYEGDDEYRAPLDSLA